MGNSENISICVQIIDKYPLTHSVIYIHKASPTYNSSHTHTRAHRNSETVHMDNSLESATTTSTTLLLVNLEASFTGVTWLRRCHSPTNQYHSESSGPTACMCVCVCVSCWKLQQLWLDSTLLTCLPDSNYMGRDVRPASADQFN